MAVIIGHTKQHQEAHRSRGQGMRPKFDVGSSTIHTRLDDVMKPVLLHALPRRLLRTHF